MKTLVWLGDVDRLQWIPALGPVLLHDAMLTAETPTVMNDAKIPDEAATDALHRKIAATAADEESNP